MTSPVTFSNAGISSWPNATVMSNGLLSLTMAPEAARVLQCRFAGKDLFFVNEAERGRVYSPADSGEWHNFGGMRFDVAPQSAWAKTSWKRDWPPPPVLNSGRLGEISGTTYIMMTDPSVPNHLDAGMKTWIALRPGSTIIEAKTELAGLAGERGWANWIVAQLNAKAGDSTVYLPQARFGSRYSVQMKPAEGESPLEGKRVDRALEFKYEGTEWKFGFEGREWIAMRPDGNEDTVVALLGTIDPLLNYPDGGSSVEYYSAAHMPYVELELLGPLRPAGRSFRSSDTFRIGIASCPGQIVHANGFGVSSRRFGMEDGRLFGTYGSFHKGFLNIVVERADGQRKLEMENMEVSPERPFKLDGMDIGTGRVTSIEASVHDEAGKQLGILDILRI